MFLIALFKGNYFDIFGKKKNIFIQTNVLQTCYFLRHLKAESLADFENLKVENYIDILIYKYMRGIGFFFLFFLQFDDLSYFVIKMVQSCFC